MTDIEPARHPAPASRPPTARDRLAPDLPGSRLLGWLGPIAVALFAAFLRFDRLSMPRKVVFDETYYAKDSLALLRFGYEHNTVKDADDLLIREGTRAAKDQIWASGGSFVAHPPGGKWMIAIGEWLFGATPFGWRFMPALVGVLSVLILARVARRMTGSTLLGCAAGLLLAVDGLHFVTSRTALLDIFVMFWVLAAFACLVADRDRARRTLATKIDEGADTSAFGPFVMHWWRIPAGLCLGMAIATKWTGLFYLMAFGLMVVVWDFNARRAAGVRQGAAGALLLEAVPAFLSMVVVAALTYLASWSGWIFNSGGWGRGEVASNPLVRPFEALPDLWRYHVQIWDFHTNLDDKHPYQSWPWDWPVLRRPVAFFYTERGHDQFCAVDKCSREVLGLGTPALWWGAAVALTVMLVVWLLRRDWRAGALLLGYAAGWLPWFYYALNNRTMFMFYATPMLPFMVLALVLAFGMLIGPAHEPGSRRVFGSAAFGAYVLIVLADFAYMYPVLAAKIIPYGDWFSRMWLKSWI